MDLSYLLDIGYFFTDILDINYILNGICHEGGFFGFLLKLSVLIIGFAFFIFSRHGYALKKWAVATFFWLVTFLILLIYLGPSDLSKGATVAISILSATAVAILAYMLFEVLFGILSFILSWILGSILLSVLSKGRPLGTVVAVILSTIIAIILTILIIKYTRPTLILITGYSFAMTAGKFFTVAFSDSEQLATVIGIILAFHGIIHQIYLYGFLRSYKEATSFDASATYQKLVQINSQESAPKASDPADSASSANSDSGHSANMTHVDPITDMVRGIYESYFQLKSQLKGEFYKTRRQLKSKLIGLSPANGKPTDNNTISAKHIAIPTLVLILIIVVISGIISPKRNKKSEENDFDSDPKEYAGDYDAAYDFDYGDDFDYENNSDYNSNPEYDYDSKYSYDSDYSYDSKYTSDEDYVSPIYIPERKSAPDFFAETNQDVRNYFKDSVEEFFDMNDFKSVFFADLNRDGMCECFVTSFSSGDSIFYQGRDGIVRFTDDLGGSSGYYLNLDNSIVAKSYLVGSYEGTSVYRFDETGFTELGSCYYDGVEDKYYINGTECSQSDMNNYRDELCQGCEYYEGADAYNAAPVYR